MTDHPEFPQESPAMRYIVEQVSKIENAEACSSGYYHSLGKVLARLDKTDTALVQLRQATEGLRKVVDTEEIRIEIWDDLNHIDNTVKTGLDAILVQNVKTVSTSLTEIQYRNNEVGKGFVRLMNEISATNKKLDSQIASVTGCLVISAWQAWLCAIGIALAGILLGRAL